MATMHILPCLLFALLAVYSAEAQVNLTMLVCSWNPGRVLRISHFGASGTTTKIANLPRPVAIDFDRRDRMVYWTDVSLKQIGKMDLNGLGRRVLLQLNRTAVPDGLAVDSSARKLFYTDTGNNLIGVMDLSGGTPTIILRGSSGLDEPRAIILDTVNRRIYWTDWGRSPYIATASYDGTGIRKIVTTGLGWPNGLSLDRQNNILYFCDAKTDKIESVSLDGRVRKQLLHEPGAHYFDITFHDGTIYFTGWRRRAIVTMSASGGPVSFIQNSLITQPAGFHLIRDTQPVPPVVIPDVSLLLCSWNPGRVLQVSKSGVATTATKLADLPRPVAVDYDPVEKMVYWTDVSRKQIGKMDLQGNNLRVLLTLSSTAVPDGLAVDSSARKLFYTDTGNNLIGVMNLSGGTPTIILRGSSGLDEPRAIILDTVNRRIYWTDWGRNPYIATASYDGTGIRKIVTTGLGWPNGLSLDRQNNILYFCDAKTDKIESVSVDGRVRKQLLHEPGAHYFDIVYNDQTIYFTGWRRRSIVTMPASGGTLTMITHSLINQPAGLHLMPTTGGSCPCSKCKEVKRVTFAQSFNQRVSYSQRYTVSCGWWGWSRCGRYRTAWRNKVAYRLATMMKPTGSCIVGCTC